MRTFHSSQLRMTMITVAVIILTLAVLFIFHVYPTAH